MIDLQIKIARDYQEMSKLAADIIADFIKAKPSGVLGLATGSTPLGLYEELVERHQEVWISQGNYLQSR